MQYSFKLILKARSFQIPPTINRLDELPNEVRQSLIFTHDHQYQVKSLVNEDVFQSFIDYWVDNKMPDIQKNNFNQYFQINQEFKLLDQIIQPKIEQWGEYFLHLNGLNSDTNQDVSFHEEQIAKELDYYLQNYSDQLMNKPIQSLFNIFNHKERNLTKHDLEYGLIKNQYNETNDLNVFILLPSLDGTKISEENINESISMKDDRLGFLPKIGTSYLKNAMEKQVMLEEQVDELKLMFKFINSKFDEEKERNDEMMASYNKEMNEMRNEFVNEIKSLNEIIEKQKNDQLVMNENNKNEINALKQVIEKQNNESILLNENYSNQIKLLNTENENQKNDILMLKNQLIQKNSIQNNTNSSFFTESSLDGPGILYKLKNDKNVSEPLFIASQSSEDVYNIINPDTNDSFSLTSLNFFVEFEIPEQITIVGFKVFSSNKHFPKTFDIEIEGKVIRSVKEASELNGKNREMAIGIEPTQSRTVRIINKGKSWNADSYYMTIKRFEILSSDPKYSKGVFASLIESNEKRNPHNCGVHITSSKFDFNSFHMIDASKNICTGDYENSWFQVELTQGTAIIYGFRLKKGNTYILKSFKLIGTDNFNKPVDEWSTMIEINEETKDDHKQLDIYKLPKPSPPVKFIRLIQTGKNWNNNNYLVLYHLDFFGYYF